MLMMSISDEVPDASRPAPRGDVGQEWAIAHGDKRLGQLEGERLEARTEAGCEDQRAGHLASMPESSPHHRSACYPKAQMSYFRSLSATLASALTVFSLVTASCGTSAVGVDDCREIEKARCQAASPCGIIDDVPACERFYRDHCLHGLAAPPPEGASVAACVQVIQAAGQCAEDGADTPLASCTPRITAAAAGLKTACDVVQHPELTSECSFLLDVPADTSSGGAGGQSSESTAGAAGVGGESQGTSSGG
jgi:hypothetical protein